VVAAIEPNLQRAEIERLKRKPAANLDAYDLLLRAQQLEYEFTAQSLAEAIRCLKQALALDPSYAQAMALAAYCYGERRHQAWVQDVEAPLLIFSSFFYVIEINKWGKATGAKTTKGRRNR
jgi:hypothetical protein